MHPKDEWLMHVSYTVRLTMPPLATASAGVRAACQVGNDRFVGETPGNSVALVQGTAVELEDIVYFMATKLPDESSLCDLEISERDLDARRVLGRFCMRDTITRGPCPPNRIADDGVGPTGVTAVLTSVEGRGAYSSFPAHLAARLKFTAHRDMPADARLAQTTSCGDRSEKTSWSDLGILRAGESALEDWKGFDIGRPRRGTKCETQFAYDPGLGADTTPIATFCHVDETITPGHCN
jgi:hypothetical protein